MLVGYIIFVALIAFGVSATIMTVGRPRKPSTPGQAVAVMFVGIVEVLYLSLLYYQATR